MKSNPNHPNHSKLCSFACATALTLACCGAAAQTAAAEKLHCQTVGSAAPEALGDRDGHALSVNHISCRVEGGAMDGGVLTGTTIYEWDKGQATVLSGSGVTRKPGAATVYQHTEGKMSLVMTDGKPSGITGSGRGRMAMATGSAAPMAGRTYSFTFRTTGPSQFVVDVKHD